MPFLAPRCVYATFSRSCVCIYIVYIFPLSVDSKLLCLSSAAALCVGLYCSSAPGKASHFPGLKCFRFPPCHSLCLARAASPLLWCLCLLVRPRSSCPRCFYPQDLNSASAHNNFSQNDRTYKDPHYNNSINNSTHGVLTHSASTYS